MKNNLYSLHGLRALAATMVVFAHMLARLVKYNIVEPTWSKYEAAGSFGVAIFFVISGFIMIRTSSSAFGSYSSAKSFYARRVIRVVPLYYIFTTIYAFKLVVLGGRVSMKELTLSLLFIPFINGDGLLQPLYSLGWTLNYEMYFYGIFASCMYFRKVVGLILMFIFFIGIVGCGLFYNRYSPIGDPIDFIGFASSPIILFFISGVSIGLIEIKFRLPPSIAFLGALVCIIFAFFTLESWLMAIAAITSVLITACERPTEDSSIGNAALKILGESSYSTYLTHSFVLGPGVSVIVLLGVTGIQYVFELSLVLVFVCLLAGIVFYSVLERPLLAILRRGIRASNRTVCSRG